MQNLVEGVPLKPRLGASRLQHREVQQLLDQTAEAGGGVEHLLAHVGDVLARGAIGVERRGRHEDRRKRRAQVVRDRAQDSCLELVAAAQRLVLDHARLQLGAVDGSDEQ